MCLKPTTRFSLSSGYYQRITANKVAPLIHFQTPFIPSNFFTTKAESEHDETVEAKEILLEATTKYFELNTDVFYEVSCTDERWVSIWGGDGCLSRVGCRHKSSPRLLKSLVWSRSVSSTAQLTAVKLVMEKQTQCLLLCAEVKWSCGSAVALHITLLHCSFTTAFLIDYKKNQYNIPLINK